MMKVTSVEPQKQNFKRTNLPKRFNIYLDGKFAFGADEDTVVKYRLVEGKEIQPDDLEKILLESEVGKLMDRMYRLFGVRQRSEREVRDYLKRLSFQRRIKGQEILSEMIVEMLIERLKVKQMVNDEEFAKAWVEARRNSKQKGTTALEMELFQKGIDRDLVEEAISFKLSAVSEKDLAKVALEKKMRAWRNLEPQQFKKKAVEFLVRKGFEYEVAREVVENSLKNE